MDTIKKFLLTIAGVACLWLSAQAQTQSPGQFWLAPQFNTPTAFTNSDYLRVSSHLRRQNIAQDMGFITGMISGQLPLYVSDRRMGTVGLSLIQENSGHLGLLSTSAALASYSYDVQLAEKHHLLGGIQLGYYSRRINWGKVTTDTQWQYGQYIGGWSGEYYSNERSGLFQANIGIGYNLTDSDGNVRIAAGIGANNVNRGKFTYLTDDTNVAEPLTLTAWASGIAYQLNDMDFSPMLRWKYEKGVGDYSGGVLVRRRMSSESSVEESHIGLSILYSPQQTTAFGIQYALPAYEIGLSYDLATGKGLDQRTRNAVEVHVAWRMMWKE